MKAFLIFIILLSAKIGLSQNVDWFRAINFNENKFSHHSSHVLGDEVLLVGLKGRDSSSTAEYSNEIYVSLIDESSNEIWTNFFTPIDSSLNSEIKILNTFLVDSILITLGECYWNDVNDFIYFYSTININSQIIKSYNLGQTSLVNINSTSVENGKLLLLKSVSQGSYVLDNINIHTNNVSSISMNIQSGISKYYENHFYNTYDSVSVNNDIYIVVQKFDTNGVLIKENSINNNLKLLPNGSVYTGFKRGINELFIEGNYDYHIANATIPGVERDYFLIKINPITLEQEQFFSLNKQFNNSTKTYADVKFAYSDKHTLIISKIVEDNNQSIVRSFLVDNNGVVWNKTLTSLGPNNLTPTFIGVNIIKNNFIQLLGLRNGSTFILNTSINNSTIDSSIMFLDATSSAIVMLNVNELEDSNILYITGSYRTNNSTYDELFLSKVNYIKTSIQEKTIKNIQVYPNPASDYVYITAEERIRRIEIRNTLGITVKQVLNENNISLVELPNGIYLIKVNFRDGTEVINRLVVNK